MTRPDQYDGHRKQIILNARSLSALKWIGEQGAVSRDHISQYQGTHSTKDTKAPGVLTTGATDQIIKRWLDLGLVARQRYITMTLAWTRLTALGMRELNLDFRATAPRLGAVSHLHAVNSCIHFTTAIIMHLQRQLKLFAKHSLSFLRTGATTGEDSIA